MKQVYAFEEAKKEMKSIVGNKGAQLGEMSSIGISVPPGFIITTKACTDYLKKRKIPDSLQKEILSALKALERKTERKFGSAANPLLVSIRSGAPISMPGMMDTILNLGLNGKSVEGLSKQSNNEWFAYDTYRRFIQMFGNVVLGIEEKKFDDVLKKEKERERAKTDQDISTEGLKKVVTEYKKIASIPDDPKKQLFMAIEAVFNSWNNKRARNYRKYKGLPDDVGTAVVVQTMVFGNLDDKSGTGVAFTRNPATGEKELYGEFLMNAQGEDIVSGKRTPQPVKMLKNVFPKLYDELLKISDKLERHYKDIQDMEFTIQQGKLYLLQTRTGKRTAMAAIKIAVDMVKEKLITKEEALMRVSTDDIEKILHPVVGPKEKYEIIAKGLDASPGAASGEIVFDPEKASLLGKKGKKVLLVREETTPDDIHGITAAQGVLTARGGITSHAAVVARGLGKPCVSGCKALVIDEKKNRCRIGNVTLKEGDILTIDGSAGAVIKGSVSLVPPKFTAETDALLSWADGVKKVDVRANTDTVDGAELARKQGAKGIGLCRTERMFNAPDRLPIVRNMILAENREERMKALNKLLPMQKNDFKDILRAMQSLPVTIRLLDIPLHEFLPSTEEISRELSYLKNFDAAVNSLQDIPDISKLLDPKLHLPLTEKFIEELTKEKYHILSKKLIQEKTDLLKKVRSLEEVNPMLGHRGVRLGITYPEIYDMQIRALYEASAELIKEGVDVHPELMVPQVCTAQELKWVFKRVKKIAREGKKECNVKVPLKFGTMIEVVRACMRAGKFSEIAEFFSFGTNDLSQATFSFSREDAEKKFLPLYTKRKILQDNPFSTIDRKGVVRLMQIAMEWGKKTRPDLKIGVCGEHGGDPYSIHIFHKIGVDYVSCSPFRVPVACLAAAQAAINERQGF
ncbi:MAG: pyruvate, phosphate dikinase [Candidatus Thermoplasmatota archaeon]|nr:pyruvate, phosphate dikinase [Candidatus Thermoplasmatota archaeon]